jgi:aspartyl/asparaginyl beta-hydroxylase (cupin superfamily)
MKKKHQLPTIANLNLNIDLQKLRNSCDKLAEKFIDVRSANPALCDNHMELVSQVYDNFEQINLTQPSEILPYTDSIKERLRRKEEHLYNVPTPEYEGSYFQEIVSQLKAPASRIRITKLAPGKTIPFHVDYDVSYAVRCICPIYGGSNVINLFKRDGNLEAYNLEDGNAYFLNIAYPHAVVNMSDQPRIALMFSLDGQDDLDGLTV